MTENWRCDHGKAADDYCPQCEGDSVIKHEMEERFDPTDADKAQELAYAACKVLVQCTRVLWSDNKGMRMGRDTATELSVALWEMATAMKILPCNPSGEDVGELWTKLCSETGLEN